MACIKLKKCSSFDEGSSFLGHTNECNELAKGYTVK